MTSGEVVVAPVLCQTPGCTFGQTGGRCVNGIADPLEGRCPDYPTPGAQTSGAESLVEDATDTEPPAGGGGLPKGLRSNFVPLPPADALETKGAYQVTSARRTHVVVVSGLARAGKTTLLTSIYERFNNGPVAGHRFAGSRTLLAFEEWCHESRGASGRAIPDTKRSPLTTPGTERFLHLRVTNGESEDGLRDLLLSDLHGELFERVRDSSAAALTMAVLPRADHFVQLLDGELLADNGERHQTAADARHILQSCLDARVLTKRSIVHVVATKWDLIRGKPIEKEVLAFWEEKVDGLRKSVGPLVGAFHAHRTSARTPTTANEEESGVEALFSCWVTDSLQRPDASHLPLETTITTREFDRFGQREQLT